MADVHKTNPCNVMLLFCWILLFQQSTYLHEEKIRYAAFNWCSFLSQRICPSGFYHHPIRDRCLRVPGGGNLIKFNFGVRCSGKFEGLLAHCRKSRYYFACRHDAVLTCMCRPKEYFSRLRLRCERKRKPTTRKEERDHEVVENILEKYKCAVQQEDGYLPIVQTEMTYRSIEVINYDPVSFYVWTCCNDL